MKKQQLKEAIKKIVRQVLKENEQQKIRFDIDPSNKDTYIVKYLDKPVGSLTSVNPVDRGEDAFGAYGGLGAPDQDYTFAATDDRFKMFDKKVSKLKKHALDFMRLITMRIEKGL